ncbi:PEP/pyruvate-binding domain-containing protein [Abyssisolibacter fermentans]|uniref:PEP/pyruvate-binding domain-containing protein n=1 Tax=Abyssisolibacter fermentans TaxID=1766203 RepID=UPI0008338F66|nr:PEP/pyruvate-binding domain-containing protein [Abyssisolibacter fermentans]
MYCGNKANRLKELEKLGFNIPKFKSTDKDFFDRFLIHIGIYEKAQMLSVKSAWVHDGFKNLYKLISNYKLDEELKEEIDDLVKDLKFPLSVRSSASTEDGDRNSAAGVFYTALNVCKNDIYKELKKVIASIYSINSTLILHDQDFHPDKYYMSVIFQEMVDGQWSGVAFSADPISNDRSVILIEAYEGLGDNLVSGLKKSHSVIMSKVGDIRKDTKLNHRLLTDLKKNVLKAEEYYGFPVDIEWTYKDEKLSILQCRPITNLCDKAEHDKYSIFSMSKLGKETYQLLGSLQSRYPKWLKKAKFFDYCEKNKILTNKWKMFSFSKKHLKNFNYDEIFHDYHSKYVSYHLSGQLVNYDKIENIPEKFEEYTNLYKDNQYCISIREYLPNQKAAISQLNEDGTIRIECVNGKMFLLNTGGIQPTIYILDKDFNVINKEITVQDLYIFDQNKIDSFPSNKKEQVTLKDTLIREIAEKTLKFTEFFNRCSVEWWIWDDVVYAADMSVLNTINSGNEGKTISNGKGKGRLRQLPAINEETIKELSMFSSISVVDQKFDVSRINIFNEIKMLIEEWTRQEDVIIYSELPYLFLAPFKDLVKGFVFKNASTLCHLSLILRENKVPAISLKGKDITNYLNKYVELDAMEGTVRLI